MAVGVCMVVEMVVVMSVVADGGWMMVVLAAGVGVVLAADDGRGGWCRFKLVQVDVGDGVESYDLAGCS